jgi:hypothetical protein
VKRRNKNHRFRAILRPAWRVERITRRLDMEDDWLRDLAAWTSKYDNVDEMWLFGSRADGTGKSQRDVHISLASLHQLVCGKITTGHSAISVP